MAKDLGLALAALESTGTDAQLGTLAASIYRRFAEVGGAGRDCSSIINTIRDSSVHDTPGGAA
jgi:3-hydroxyisobutyrate dehydrogenase